MAKGTGKSSFTSKNDGKGSASPLSQQAMKRAEALTGSNKGKNDSHDPHGDHVRNQDLLRQVGQHNSTSENASDH